VEYFFSCTGDVGMRNVSEDVDAMIHLDNIKISPRCIVVQSKYGPGISRWLKEIAHYLKRGESGSRISWDHPFLKRERAKDEEISSEGDYLSKEERSDTRQPQL
jgi:uncharacterized cysteine cluster protein YcgN (CxxCxxCC family)